MRTLAAARKRRFAKPGVGRDAKSPPVPETQTAVRDSAKNTSDSTPSPARRCAAAPMQGPSSSPWTAWIRQASARAELRVKRVAKPETRAVCGCQSSPLAVRRRAFQRIPTPAPSPSPADGKEPQPATPIGAVITRCTAADDAAADDASADDASAGGASFLLGVFGVGVEAGGGFPSRSEAEEGRASLLVGGAETPSLVDRARSAMAIAAAPANSSQLRASITRELATLPTPMARSSRKPLSTRSTWPDARTSATLLGLAPPPSRVSTRAWTFSAEGQPGGPFQDRAKVGDGWAATAEDHPTTKRPVKPPPAFLTFPAMPAIAVALAHLTRGWVGSRSPSVAHSGGHRDFLLRRGRMRRA